MRFIVAGHWAEKLSTGLTSADGNDRRHELVIPQAAVDNCESYTQGGVSGGSATLMCTSDNDCYLGVDEL